MPAEMMAAPTKKPFPMAVIVIVVVVILLGGGAAAWFLSRLKAISQTPPTAQVPAPVTAPSPPPAAESVSTASPLEEAPAPAPAALPPAVSTAPRKRAAKPAPTPAPTAPAVNPQAEQILKLQTLARDAYAKRNYAEPAAANAISYAKQVLALDAGNDYAKTILKDSVEGGKYQMQQAIARKDFTAARRVADAMAKLLPERRDVAELTQDIASAERADRSPPPPQAPTATVSFRAYHLHKDKAPADDGPYCTGSLSVLAGHLKFSSERSTDGKTHTFDLACSDIREIKGNSRLASRQNGFHVRAGKTTLNFVPEDSSAAHLPFLTSACSK